MKYALVFLLVSVNGWAMTVSPANLSVSCDQNGHELSLIGQLRGYNSPDRTPTPVNLYRTPAYPNVDICRQDAYRVEALVNFAKLLGKYISIDAKGGELAKVLRVVERDGTPVTKIMPQFLKVRCLESGLTVFVGEDAIYATSRYGTDGRYVCAEDKARLVSKIVGAQIAGKALRYRFGNSPNEDFAIDE